MSALPHEASHGRGERCGFRMDKCARAIAQAIFIPILGVDLGAGIDSSCPSENYPLSRTASRTLVILSIVSILLCGVSRTFLEFN